MQETTTETAAASSTHESFRLPNVMVCLADAYGGQIGLNASEVVQVVPHRNTDGMTFVKMRDGSYFFVKAVAEDVICQLAEMSAFDA